MARKALDKNLNIPIQCTDLSIFDEAYTAMKERFATEMKRMDEEMSKFSKDLMRLYAESTTIQASQVGGSIQNTSTTDWETIANSPLISGEGPEKKLKLQFDVSQFQPDEVTVQVLHNALIVLAKHDENTDGNTIIREYKREFLLPRGLDTNTIVSSLSKDGVLTVEAQVPKLEVTDEELETLESKDIQM